MPNEEIKDIPAVQLAPLAKNPELIRVKTISAKITDQLPMIQKFSREQWEQVEIIGRTGSQIILARDKNTGALIRIHGLCFIEAMQDALREKGVDYKDANVHAQNTLACYDQLFEV